MLFYILFLFGLYGWVEFEALILIGSEIGGLASFLGIFVTAFIGMWLVRTQGRKLMESWQNNMREVRVEASSLSNGLALLLGGFLMLLPGYVTDGLGLICFIPGLRSIIGALLVSRISIGQLANSFSFRSNFSQTSSADSKDENIRKSRKSRPSLDGDIIEGQYQEKE
jgi:UPF0716 protein FxsA